GDVDVAGRVGRDGARVDVANGRPGNHPPLPARALVTAERDPEIAAQVERVVEVTVGADSTRAGNMTDPAPTKRARRVGAGDRRERPATVQGAVARERRGHDVEAAVAAVVDQVPIPPGTLATARRRP